MKSTKRKFIESKVLRKVRSKCLICISIPFQGPYEVRKQIHGLWHTDIMLIDPWPRWLRPPSRAGKEVCLMYIHTPTIFGCQRRCVVACGMSEKGAWPWREGTTANAWSTSQKWESMLVRDREEDRSRSKWRGHEPHCRNDGEAVEDDRELELGKPCSAGR